MSVIIQTAGTTATVDGDVEVAIAELRKHTAAHKLYTAADRTVREINALSCGLKRVYNTSLPGEDMFERMARYIVLEKKLV